MQTLWSVLLLTIVGCFVFFSFSFLFVFRLSCSLRNSLWWICLFFVLGFFFFLRWWVWLTGYPNIKMGSKSQHCQTWYMKVASAVFPSEWTSQACRGVRERQMGEMLFVFLMDVPSWETAVSSCVPFGHAQWGRVSTWVDWQQVSQQLPSFALACRSPCPASPPFRTRAYPQASEKPAC